MAPQRMSAYGQALRTVMPRHVSRETERAARERVPVTNAEDFARSRDCQWWAVIGFTCFRCKKAESQPELARPHGGGEAAKQRAESDDGEQRQSGGAARQSSARGRGSWLLSC